MGDKQKYLWRKKPVTVLAAQWFCNGHCPPWAQASVKECGTHIEISTLEGVMRGDPGDWILRGVKGEIYPCKPDIFEATYEPASVPTSDEQKPVKIKPLEWGDHHDGGLQAVPAGLVRYRVHRNGDDWYLNHDHMGKGGKEAAQADYEARIRSALVDGGPNG